MIAAQISRRRRRARQRNSTTPPKRQRGAALVEMAMVLPLLIMLAFGMVETGMGWRNAITVTSAARQGARVTSHLGQEPRSDQEGVLAVQAVMGADLDNVELVVIYNANGSGALPPACLTASRNAGGVQCNRYTPAMIANANVNGLWGCGTGAYDATWCPTTRDNDTRTADHIGVFVLFQHTYFTGIIPGDAPLIERQTVMRVEPEVD